MSIPLDFGGVANEPMPEGNYLLKVNDATVKDNKAKDGQMIIWEFDVVEPDEFMGRKMWMNTSLKPQARWKLQEVLEAISGKEFREDGMDVELVEFVGDLVSAEVYQDEYEGKVNNKINRLYHYEG